MGALEGKENPEEDRGEGQEGEADRQEEGEEGDVEGLHWLGVD